MNKIGEHYSKDDYRELVFACIELDEESYSDLCELQPKGDWDCEKHEEFGRFLVEKGVFKTLDEFLKYCDDFEIHYITTLWEVLDLLADCVDVDEVELLVEYVDQHRDYAEASYQSAKKYIEDYDSDED